ncbi:GntR family transcriptional regulator [Lederbergia citrea]|uniref:GntR family transcriptional regulator n=1 Tax=Lederbergia citrea TaxID=2833581 RepID=A0A942URN7_9BACI|nr:GntR family transcriptional regulator [Lederbergia citrea]MBS4178628.1 GntR family transcriptional regulator [Lederbergia citrea]MBS4205315.1 GntR family transcriptional regulator [Lederbergia citrea]MBS4224372.1 GntR family transcriptional regulator [Lederbergia citrea]
MILTLDLQSEVPIYLQLRNNIIEGIASKELKPGEALPSVRAMAADLGVNMHTINKAYQILKQDGFILIHRQKGVVIHPDGMPEIDEAYTSAIKEQLRPIISEAICRGMDEKDFYKLCEDIFADIKQ